jgi:hypothetical protein
VAAIDKEWANAIKAADQNHSKRIKEANEEYAKLISGVTPAVTDPVANAAALAQAMEAYILNSKDEKGNPKKVPAGELKSHFKTSMDPTFVLGEAIKAGRIIQQAKGKGFTYSAAVPAAGQAVSGPKAA